MLKSEYYFHLASKDQFQGNDTRLSNSLYSTNGKNFKHGKLFLFILDSHNSKKLWMGNFEGRMHTVADRPVQQFRGQAIQEKAEDEGQKEQKGQEQLHQFAPPPFQLKSQTVQKQESPEEDEMLQGKFEGKINAGGAGQPFQLKESTANGGLPGQLKSGVEKLSGFSMNDVNVHYNSDKPAQLNAHAYAQGTDIHIASGQEKHLPHEAWHVAQQKQGRVNATTQAKGVNINDDTSLEKEADVMGEKAMNVQTDSSSDQSIQKKSSSPFSAISQLFSKVVQMVKPASKAAATAKINASGEYYKNGVIGGGKYFGNNEKRLPQGTGRNRITYKEYDVNPYTGRNRGAERIVKGSDGRIWYTSNHYKSFTEIT